MRRFLKSVITIILCVALTAGGVLYGPQVYRLLFGGANATWISERFSEELIQKRELIVLEKVITGQENISTDAWLIGTVQEVVIPYTFAADYSVDLSSAAVAYNADRSVIEVRVPTPEVNHYKLTVDENSVEKYDFLYPLTSDRYAEMKQEIEKKLYDEIVSDPELAESAWAAVVSEMEALYQALLDGSDTAADFDIEVIKAVTQPPAEE